MKLLSNIPKPFHRVVYRMTVIQGVINLLDILSTDLFSFSSSIKILRLKKLHIVQGIHMYVHVVGSKGNKLLIIGLHSYKPGVSDVYHSLILLTWRNILLAKVTTGFHLWILCLSLKYYNVGHNSCLKRHTSFNKFSLLTQYLSNYRQLFLKISCF